MSSVDERLVGKIGRGQRSRSGAVTAAARRIMVGLAFFLGGLLLLGLIFPRHHATHRRPRAALAAPPGPQTAFQASFAQAQQCYLRAEVVTTQQLDALEEWDGDSIQGSAPEVYRRSLIAHTREIALAEAAAREACRRAQTNDEIYRATRLLLHVERDMERPRLELKLAKKLVALRPHDQQALLLLERAAGDHGRCRRRTGRRQRWANGPDLLPRFRPRAAPGVRHKKLGTS